MTKNNVVSIDQRLTYEQAIKNHLDSLDNEYLSAKLTDMIIISSTDLGEAFTVVQGDNLTYLVGLIEIIKTYLLQSEV